MEVGIRLKDLPPGRNWIVGLMQYINYGRIQFLPVRGGDPVFGKSLQWQIDYKVCAENGPRPEMALGDYLLRKEVISMFECFQKLGNGIVVNIEVKGGLPFMITVQQCAA